MISLNSTRWILAFAGTTLAVLAIAASRAQAADFDGSRRLICATQEVQACTPASPCLRFLPQEVGAPEFVRIDFDKREIRGPKRATPIKWQERDAEGVIVQGTELGYGWSIAIDAAGEMTATLVDQGNGYALFGACTTED